MDLIDDGDGGSTGENQTPMQNYSLLSVYIVRYGSLKLNKNCYDNLYMSRNIDWCEYQIFIGLSNKT